MLHKEFGLISIIMAAYNAEKTIEQAINSVLRQTYTDFELLVVNDCSKDRTVELVRGLRISWKSRLSFKRERMLICFSRVQLLWTRMGGQSTGIFMLRQK